MKVLIAIVMFLFGLFVGILIIPTFKEFSTSMLSEEEYSTPRMKTVLSGFGITLPLEAADINLYLKQGEKERQVWVKFECPADAKDEFMQRMKARHAGMFNREIEFPKMFDGTPVTWWTFNNSFRYYEFDSMCAAYDELLQQVYLYAVQDDARREPEAPSSSLGED